MNDWPAIDLESALVSNGVSYGIVQPGQADPNGVPIVRVADMLGDRIRQDEPLRVANCVEAAHSRTRLRGGEVLVTIVGTVGRVAIAPPELAGWNVARAVAVLRPKVPTDAKWIRYALLAPAVQEQMQVRKTDTVQATLNLRDVKKLSIPWPAETDRWRIAAVLGALDDLIETERALAEATIALVNAEFTRRFGDRRLSIDAGSLGRVIDCLHSKKPELVSGGRTLLQLNNIRDDGLVDRGPSYGISDRDYATWSRKLETRPWDLVITNVGRIGAVARIPDDYAVAIGRNMTALRPALPELDGAFLIASFLSSAVRSEIEARTDAGTVMSALNVRSIPHLRLQDSTPEERTAFHQVAAPLLREADASLASILDLSRARDELLPLLMSGKVGVSEDLAVA